jgi:rRNA maturation RNase YbeY
VLPGWEVSLVFAGEKRAQALNKKLRGKSYIPNVLSYALSKKSGEIIICPREADRQAASFDMNKREFTLYLFIHGLLHIKGWVHGATMEKCERDLLAKFAKGLA